MEPKKVEVEIVGQYNEFIIADENFSDGTCIHVISRERYELAKKMITEKLKKEKRLLTPEEISSIESSMERKYKEEEARYFVDYLYCTIEKELNYK